MAIYFKEENLFPLLSHHIAVMERLDEDDHEFSIICFKMDISSREIEEILQKSLRKTDIVSNIGNFYIAFLPFTDYSGAYTLLSGINKFLNQPNLETISAYPEDGKNAFQILENFSAVLEDNFNSDFNFL